MHTKMATWKRVAFFFFQYICVAVKIDQPYDLINLSRILDQFAQLLYSLNNVVRLS